MVPLAGLIDVGAERARLGKEIDRLEKDLERIEKEALQRELRGQSPGSRCRQRARQG